MNTAVREPKLKNKIKVYNHNNEYTQEQIDRMVKMYESYGMSPIAPKKGNVISGILMGTLGDQILVDIRYKDYIMVNNNKDEINALHKAGASEGKEVDLLITEVSENPYIIRGSFAEIFNKDVHIDIMEHSEETAYSATVIESTLAGYVLEVAYDDDHNVIAFMPNTLAGVNKIADPSSLVGKSMYVMIDGYSQDRGTFIASRKKYLSSIIPQQIEKLKISDKSGTPIEYTGYVTGTTKFGVFVEFAGDDSDEVCLTGMIHFGALDDTWKSKIEDIKSGTEIKFFIREKIKEKLILTQVWKKSLWDTLSPNDEFVDRTIKYANKLGLLVELDSETQGLIHNSVLEKSAKKYAVGDTISVKVLAANKSERKIFLTILDKKSK